MLETLISSKTRIKLLLRFFLNSKTTAYLRGLESELGDSTNAIRIELNRFEKAGMLTSFQNGNKKLFKANTDHPLYKDTHNLVMKYIGLDRIIDSVIENLGEVKKVFVTGDFAQGLDSAIIDLVFVGEINRDYLSKLIEKVEQHLHRKIRYIICSEQEMKTMNWSVVLDEALLLWEN